MSKAPFQIITPTPEHRSQLMALLPRLAAFEVPARRNPDHLWQGDGRLLDSWFAGERPTLHVRCALSPAGDVAGLAFFSLRPELLSGEPSAHLEALAVSAQHEGQGVASALLDACHTLARELGATSMTLHVFNTNTRAQALYAHKGYEPELRRCIKWLD